MKVTVDNLVIDYETWGEGKKTILVIHGWSKGISKEKYLPLLNLLALKYRVIALDLPGFGGSGKLKEIYDLDNYAELIVTFIKKIDQYPDYILGHSFGGRIAVRLAARKLLNFERLILIDSAGIEKKSLKAKIIIGIVSLVPKPIKNKLSGLIGSKDYREAGSELMRETMKKVIGENLEQDLERIDTETLLIWGDKDQMTPVENGRRMEELIKKSELVVLSGNHGLPYRNPNEVANVIIEKIKWIT